MSRFSNLKSFIYAEDQKSSAFVDSKDINAQVTGNAVSEDSVVQKVGMPTDSSIKEMSEFDDIAVSEQPERIDVMELSDVAPLKLDVIVDSTGFLSDKSHYQKQTTQNIANTTVNALILSSCTKYWIFRY